MKTPTRTIEIITRDNSGLRWAILAIGASLVFASFIAMLMQGISYVVFKWLSVQLLMLISGLAIMVFSLIGNVILRSKGKVIEVPFGSADWDDVIVEDNDLENSR